MCKNLLDNLYFCPIYKFEGSSEWVCVDSYWTESVFHLTMCSHKKYDSTKYCPVHLPHKIYVSIRVLMIHKVDLLLWFVPHEFYIYIYIYKKECVHMY
jgi:hypothetical protein